MIRKKWMRCFAAAGVASGILTGISFSDITDITVTRDASIYSEAPGNQLANGSGEYLFAGVNGVNNSFNVRRTLLYFDITAALPVGAVVTSATLRLNVDQEPFGVDPADATLHAAESDWGEGPSNPIGPEGSGTAAMAGDSTWNDAFFGVTSWTTAGGDFNATASATTSLNGLGIVLFSSPTMASDVQSWYDTPSQNFGWFLLVDETGTRNARRFTSGEDSDLESTIPLLTVGYTVVPEPASISLLIAGLFSMTLARRRSNDWKLSVIEVPMPGRLRW